MCYLVLINIVANILILFIISNKRRYKKTKHSKNKLATSITDVVSIHDTKNDFDETTIEKYRRLL